MLVVYILRLYMLVVLILFYFNGDTFVTTFFILCNIFFHLFTFLQISERHSNQFECNNILHVDINIQVTCQCRLTILLPYLHMIVLSVACNDSRLPPITNTARRIGLTHKQIMKQH